MKGEIVKLESLDGPTKAAMYDLFSKQFDNVTYNDFNQDLADKNWVLLLRNEKGRLGGFSTMHVFDREIAGCETTVVYSGDTVVDASSWRDSALSYSWMGAIDYLRRLHGRHQMFWFLLVSGYRTYRFLPVYSDCYYPRAGRATPDDFQAALDTLANERFGDRYDAKKGVVRLRVPAVLKAEFRGIPENRLTDPHIEYFAERNPGHEEGDELVCGCVLADDRLTRLGQRMWNKGRRVFAQTAGE